MTPGPQEGHISGLISSNFKAILFFQILTYDKPNRIFSILITNNVIQLLPQQLKSFKTSLQKPTYIAIIGIHGYIADLL